jgi:metallo-beta-lactamase family protein
MGIYCLITAYGDRNHEDRKKRVEILKNCLAKAQKDGGIVYIPAFLLEQLQFLFEDLYKQAVKVLPKGHKGLGRTRIN